MVFREIKHMYRLRNKPAWCCSLLTYKDQPNYSVFLKNELCIKELKVQNDTPVQQEYLLSVSCTNVCVQLK